MDDRKEYWWVHHEAAVQPAEVDFVGGIPVGFRFIGRAGTIAASSAELLERLPAPPRPVLKPQAPQPAPAEPRRRGSWLWFIGILLLILVAQCSGDLFDLIK
ncbi:hypothetical protein [Microvirga yunnanensis]|uniref:hypothetical protein n=1 Tax=Microvirga yunnanensis TaxID=2953740 RepID=UPI0021C79815|nr:hypothetical protein [Microvirga sp. HBU65207]